MDDSSNFYFSFGRMINFKNSENIRLNISFGVASTKGSKSYDCIKVKNILKTLICIFMINPKFEFVPISVCGLYLSPKVMYNEKRIYYGIRVGIMLEKLR